MPDGGLPATIPAIATPSSSAAWCVVYAGAGRHVETGGQLPSGGAPTGILSDVGQVALPPGAGALVGVGPGHTISYFLVAGGRRYALASTQVAGMLDYKLSQAVRLPAGVVELIPAGPVLDPVTAAQQVESALAEIRAQQTRLMGFHDELSASWKGAASAAFTNAFMQFNDDFGIVIRALQGIQERLVGSHSNYDAAESANTTTANKISAALNR